MHWGCAGIALAISASTLCAAGIASSGTPEQIGRWIPEVVGSADSPKIGAYAVTEPQAGSDVKSLRTTAKRDEEGYVCNHLFYGVRHALERRGCPLPMGFVHVPPLPEQVAGELGRTGLALERYGACGGDHPAGTRRRLGGRLLPPDPQAARDFDCLLRQREVEGAALVRFGGQPDPAAVVLHDLPADRQSDAGTLVFTPVCRRWNTMKTRSKCSGAMPRPLSRTSKRQWPGSSAQSMVISGTVVGRAVLDRVADQVLEQPGQLVAVRRHDRQVGGHVEDRAAFVDGDLQVVAAVAIDVADRVGAIGLLRRPTREYSSRSRISRSIRTPPSRAKPMNSLRVLVELVAIAPLEQRQVAVDHAQRLAQVVGCDIGELLQFRVGSLEFFRLPGHALMRLGDFVARAGCGRSCRS